MSAVHHETAHFAGRVQGVGFRYQTLQAARGFEVSGYVCNLADGRVRLEVEGQEDEVRAFLAAVEEQMEGYIRKVERTAQVRAAQFKGFSIR